MSNNQNWIKIRDDIKNSVQDVLENGDFSSSIQKLTDTASIAIEEAKYQIEKSQFAKSNKELRYRNTEDYNMYRAESPNYSHGKSVVRQGAQSVEKTSPYKRFMPKLFSPAKKFFSIVQLMAGIPLAFGFGTAMLALISTFLFGGVVGSFVLGDFVSAFIICTAFFGGAMYLNISAFNTLKRISKAKEYIRMAGDKTYINIADLSALSGESIPLVTKNLKKMISQGIFPEGHLDFEQKCLILSNRTYREYLSLMQARKQAAEIAPETQKELSEMNSEAAALSPEEQKEWYHMIHEGEEYIRTLKGLNENIAGEEISDKLSKLELLLQSIFNRIREKPKETSQMHKFMDYYLPTTLKLVHTYREFDALIEPDQDVLNTKKEIESTLDTINQAFSELLNKLFRNAVYDASTDAQVLQTMLAKEGLVDQMENSSK